MATPPQLVGSAFVNQYYNVLNHSQQVVHRFYNDASCLTRAEAGPEGPVDTVYAQSGIHEKIMSVDYGDLRAEIRSIDCQDSYNGSVLVMVTGCLSLKHSGRRDFVQTFFLAPQERGFFVLNDIFRYLDEPHATKCPFPLAEPDEPPATAAAPIAAMVKPDVDDTGLADEAVQYDIPENEDTEEDEVVAEEISQAPDAEQSAATEAEAIFSHDESQGDHPKKSYASILGGSHSQAAAQPAPRAPSAEKTQAPSPQAGPAAAPAPPPPIEAPEEIEVVDSEVKSIYVKSLPSTITTAQLEEELRKFGQTKAGGIAIKRQHHGCYAFAEFVEAAAARTAVEAGSFMIDGKQVHIEEKRPQTSRSFRGPRGRGRNEGGRGGRGSSGGYYNSASSGSSGGRGSTGRNNNNNASGNGSLSNSNTSGTSNAASSSNSNGSYSHDGAPGGRGRGGYRGSYGNSSSSNHGHSNYNSSANNSDDSGYHRYDSYNNQSSSSSGSRGGRRYPRNTSFRGAPPAAAAATITAA